MAWLIQHKCNDADGIQDYGLIKGKMKPRGDISGIDQPVTQAKCTRCGEELVFLGHDVFNEAQQSQVLDGFPPGFFVPRSVRA